MRSSTACRRASASSCCIVRGTPSGVESLCKQVVERTGCQRRDELIEFLRQAEVLGRVKA